jgi:hypothetical protein
MPTSRALTTRRTNDRQGCLSQQPRPARPESAGTPGERDLRPARCRLALEAVVATLARETLALDEQPKRSGDGCSSAKPAVSDRRLDPRPTATSDESEQSPVSDPP